jgi:hypothetical protein
MKNNIFSQGSYLIVEPVKEEGGVTKGVVFISNMNKQYDKGDIIYYLKQDTVEIVFDEVNCHAITYYNILARDGVDITIKEELDIESVDYDKGLIKFKGLVMGEDGAMKI